MAERGEFDVLKVSYAVLPWVLDEYALLPCGGALGRGCGPLVLTRDGGGAKDLAGATVAVPSERSTAYLLFRLWAATEVPGGVGRIEVLPFHEIMPAVRDGRVDAGLVIHEARFTYQDYGLPCLADMGEHWERTTGLPIPLGAIIASRSLGADAAAAARRQRPRLGAGGLGRPGRVPRVRAGARAGDGPGGGRPAHRAVRQRVHRRPRRGRLRGGARAARPARRPRAWCRPSARTRSSSPPDVARRVAGRTFAEVTRPAGRRPRAARRRSCGRAPSPGTGRAAASGAMSSSSVVRSCTMGSSSSGLRRCAAATEGAGSSTVTDSAWSPRWPATTPNSTRWPGLSASTPSGSTDECTKTSPPSSRERKPKPFSLLNHLTLPVGTSDLVLVARTLVAPRRKPPRPDAGRGALDSSAAGQPMTRLRTRLMASARPSRRRRPASAAPRTGPTLVR